jgi:hypothetical protein
MDAVRRLLRLAVSDIQLIHDVEGSQRLPVGVRLLTIAATLAVTLASMLAGARSTLANQPPQVLTRVFSSTGKLKR